MSDINWSFVDEINERSKDDRAMIVGSEVRQLVMYLRQLRAEVAKDYGSGDLEKRFYTVSSIDKLKGERERLIDAAWKFIVKKVPSASCDEVRTALASTPQPSGGRP